MSVHAITVVPLAILGVVWESLGISREICWAIGTASVRYLHYLQYGWGQVHPFVWHDDDCEEEAGRIVWMGSNGQEEKTALISDN